MAWEDFNSVVGSSQSPLFISGPIALGKSRLGRKQRSIEKAGMVEAYRRSVENNHAFQEHSDINRQRLQQQYAVRGLGQSSVADQGTAQFERDTARTQANLDYEAEAARQRLGLYRKQQVYKRRIGPLLFIDNLLNKAAQVLSMSSGGGAGGGNQEQAPPGPAYGNERFGDQTYDSGWA